jgi:hypothetical protein
MATANKKLFMSIEAPELNPNKRKKDGQRITKGQQGTARNKSGHLPDIPTTSRYHPR